MLRLLKTPEHIPALAPAYEREILYRVLIGPQGWRLRRLFQAHKKIPVSIRPSTVRRQPGTLRN